MIMKTTNREDFKDFKIVPKSSRRSQSCETLPDSKTIITPEKRRVIPNNSKEFQSTLTLISPFYHKSSYNFNFYNYGQYQNHYERCPQYPIYKLPFKGNSIYRENFVKNLDIQQQKAKEWNHTISAPSLDPKEIKLKVSADHIKPKYSIVKMERVPQTLDPKEFDVAYKSASFKPKDEVVQNMKIPSHFQTMYRSEFNQKEMVKKKVKPRMPFIY